MSSLITRTKIILPSRRPEILTRQRLLDLLFELLDFKLIILAAPAGYGKTSLLIDFIYQSDIPACWYSLDVLDKDPQRFLAHFVASIARRFPEFGERSSAILNMVNQVNLDVERIVATMVNDLYDHVHEHFLIVLDDYHLVLGSEDIDTFINKFVQETNENCHLVLASRSLLTLPDMPLMVARGLVSGLSYEELAFNALEIQSLALQNYRMSLPTQTAIDLANETEGWITGLLLSTHRNWKGDLTQLRAARISGVDLYDYLAQQVLDQQSFPVREFLLRTSLLEEFNKELCEKVFGSEADIQALIEAVSTRNLFILPIGSEGEWFRYHHLFRDFLQARIAREQPAEYVEILRKLASVYQKMGEYEKSFVTYKRLGDLEATSTLITEVGSIYLKSGRLQTLAAWLREFPEEIILSHPQLNSIRGAVSVMQGRVEEGLYWLRQAEHTQRITCDHRELAITLIRLSSALRFLGMYEESLEKASESLELIDSCEELRYPHAEGLRSLGITLYQIGRVDQAAEKLEQSYEIYQTIGDKQNVALILMELGITSKIAGKYQQALAYYEEALSIWRGAKNLVGQANLLNNLAVLRHLVGDYDQAGIHFEEGLELATRSGYTRMQAYILCGIGDLYKDIGAEEAAKDAYKRSAELAVTSQERFLQFYLLVKESGFARIEGNNVRAYEILEKAKDLLSGSSSFYEIGIWEFEQGHLNNALGNNDQAIEYFRHAGDHFLSAGQKVDAVRAYFHLAGRYFKDNINALAENALRDALALSSTLDTLHIFVIAGIENFELIRGLSTLPEFAPQLSKINDLISNFQARIPAIRKHLRPYATANKFVAPQLSITALGFSQIKVNGEIVNVNEWQSQRKVRELFFYLLNHSEGLTKEEVGVVLWPESSSSQMKLQFKNSLYRLRYALGQEIISLVKERYFFNRSLDYIYDVEEFVKAISGAQAYKDSAQRIRALRHAITLYKGNYLADFDSTWLMHERERLWKFYSDATLTLAQLYLEVGENQLALDYSQRLVNEDPCMEEAHQVAMSAYAALGDRASVIRQYESCRRSLMEEIKAKPSQKTSSLYESLIK